MSIASDALAKRIRPLVSRKPEIVEKKMFGGIGFMLDGNMLVGVIKDELMARVELELGVGRGEGMGYRGRGVGVRVGVTDREDVGTRHGRGLHVLGDLTLVERDPSPLERDAVPGLLRDGDKCFQVVSWRRRCRSRR